VPEHQLKRPRKSRASVLNFFKTHLRQSFFWKIFYLTLHLLSDS
jgi:hypothetical protein